VDTPLRTPADRHRLTAAIVAALALVAAVILGLVLINRDDDASAPPTTGANTTVPVSTTTVASTTTAPTTTTTPTTTTLAPTTTTPTRPGFDPACVESQRGTPTTPVDEALLSELQPLGAVPAIRVTLPASLGITDSFDPMVNVSAVPGGLLVLVSPSQNDNSFYGSMRAVIDFDRTYRWVRCSDQIVAESFTTDDPGSRIVLVYEPQRMSFRTMSLSDGSLGDEVLVEPPFTPVEPEWPRLQFSGGPDASRFLVALAEDGSELWRDETLGDRGGEGFSSGGNGDTRVAFGCINRNEQQTCLEYELRGYRTMTGERLWQLGGLRNVSAVADGYALVSEPLIPLVSGGFRGGAWTMIDTETGVAVPGQRWEDPSTFEQACCGDGDYVYVRTFGGVVVTMNRRTLSVWLPEGLNTDTVELTMP
jgi:hypothetical protein